MDARPSSIGATSCHQVRVATYWLAVSLMSCPLTHSRVASTKPPFKGRLLGRREGGSPFQKSGAGVRSGLVGKLACISCRRLCAVQSWECGFCVQASVFSVDRPVQLPCRKALSGPIPLHGVREWEVLLYGVVTQGRWRALFHIVINSLPLSGSVGGFFLQQPGVSAWVLVAWGRCNKVL